MAVLRPRASVLALAVAALAASQSDARDRSKSGESNVILELAHPTQKGFDDVVLELAPLRPSNGAAANRAPIVETLSQPAPAKPGTPDEPIDISATPGASPEVAAAAAPKRAALEPASVAAAGPAGGAAAPPPQAASSANENVAVRAAQPAAAAAGAPAGVGAQAPQPVPQPEANGAVQAAQPRAVAPGAPVTVSEPAPQPARPAAPSVAGDQASAPPTADVDRQKTGAPGAPRADAGQTAGGTQAARTASAPPKPAEQEEGPAALAPPAKSAAGSVANVAPSAAPAPSPAETLADPDADKAYAAAIARGVRGPTEVRLADRGTLWLPAGRVFVGPEAAKQLYAEVPGAWDGAKLGVVLPVQRMANWVAFVELVDDGFVADQGEQGLDPAQVLAGMRRLAAQENGDRRRAGEAPLALTGWVDPPRYDEKHRLGSCLGVTAQDSTDAGDRLVDCTAFALGRQGALKIQIVAAEEDLPRFRGEAAALVAAFVYDRGKAYEDFDAAADKTAPYDLSGLMTGGLSQQQPLAAPGANTAQKAGLIALIGSKLLKFWKLLLVAAAVGYFAFRWLRGRRSGSESPATRGVGPKPPAAEPGLLARLLAPVRDRFGAMQGGKPARAAARVAAAGGASVDAATTAVVTAQEKPSPFARISAFVNEKLPRRSDPMQAMKRREEAQAEAKAASATLSRLAGMMRKQEQTAAGEGEGDVAAPQRPLDGAAFEPTAQAQPKRVLPGAAVDLVEPGDRQAASAALSAQQALRQATA